VKATPAVHALVAAGLLAATGCVPYPSSSDIVDQDIVISHYNDKANFGSYKTFALPDKIPVLKENELGQTDVTYQDAPEIIAAVRRNMVARGYTEVTQAPGATVDLAVGMAAVSNTIQIYSGSYCYYYSYWYWYYPCYPTYPYYSSYNARTFVLDIADAKAEAANKPTDGGVNPAGIIWSNWLYGVVSSNYTWEVSQIVSGIDEAFAQSPYVKAGN
jgi:hypothetical protein